MTQIIERPPMHGDDVPEPFFTSVAAVADTTMAQAINRALHDAMAADDRVQVFGEDVARLGGVFRVTEGLAETFGDGRCFDTPLAESAIVGIAIAPASPTAVIAAKAFLCMRVPFRWTTCRIGVRAKTLREEGLAIGEGPKGRSRR